MQTSRTHGVLRGEDRRRHGEGRRQSGGVHVEAALHHDGDVVDLLDFWHILSRVDYNVAGGWYSLYPPLQFMLTALVLKFACTVAGALMVAVVLADHLLRHRGQCGK